MFQLPTLQPCEGLPVWLMADDDLTQALVLWWPSGTAWVIHGTTPTDPNTSTDRVDAA